MSLELELSVKAFKLLRPVFVPTLLAYLFVGPLSLRVWLAVKQTSPLPEVKRDAKLKCASIVLAALILATIVGLEMAVMVLASESHLTIGLTVIYARMFELNLLWLLRDITGLTQWSVHRTSSGAPIFLPVKQVYTKKQKAAKLGLFVAAVLVTVCAFAFEESGAVTSVATILSASAIYVMSGRNNRGKMKMRVLIIVMLGIFFALLCLIAVKKASSPLTNTPDGSSMIRDGWVKVERVFFALVKRYVWLFPSFYASIPGALVAVSYRFDYQRHLDTSETSTEFILDTIPAPEPKSKSVMYGDGVLIPRRAPSSFPKTYYTTALVAFVFSQISLALIITYYNIMRLEEDWVFGILAVYLELFIMPLFLMIMAILRGEWKIFWSYRETLPESVDNDSEKGASASDDVIS